MAGGPSWHRQLEGIGGDRLATALLPRLRTAHSRAIEYPRGTITEPYLPRSQSIEQPFVIEKRAAHREVLMISGKVDCDGRLEQYPSGWLWRAPDGEVVSLGGVKVFDAAGEILPVKMEVTEGLTEITIGGDALALATYPVTVDPEIGTNDFRISASLDDFDATTPDVAFNSTRNEFLVVWRADSTAGQQREFEFETIGQRLDAETGALLGTPQFVISTSFDDGDTDEGEPASTAVAYNSSDDDYLVVWHDAQREIPGQILDGSTPVRWGATLSLAT